MTIYEILRSKYSDEEVEEMLKISIETSSATKKD